MTRTRRGTVARTRTDGKRKASWTIRTVATVALGAVGLAGCAGLGGYGVRAEPAAQVDVIGDVVRTQATFCLQGTCDGTGALPFSLPDAAGDAGVQLLVAFLVPATAVSPGGASADLPGTGPGVAFDRLPALDAALQRDRPAPAGRRWAGFASGVLDPAALRDGADWSARADFTIGRGPGGLPTPAGFAHSVMGGVRLATGGDAGQSAWPGDLAASRPVDCDEHRGFPSDAFADELAGLPRDDAGRPLVPTTLCGPTSAGVTLALRDLRGAGAAVGAAPGTSVAVPFTLRYAGEPGPVFALTATTAVAGATATPSTATLAPASAGFQDVTVTVAVPADAPAGDHAVELVATVGDQVRRAVGTVRVARAPAPAAPATGGPTDQSTFDDVVAPVYGMGAEAPLDPGARFLDFSGADRAGLVAGGSAIDLGEARCHKIEGACAFAAVRVGVRPDELGAPAGAAAATEPGRERLVTIARARFSVPAQSSRRVVVTVGRRVRRLLRAGGALHALVAVRSADGTTPVVQRVTLQQP